MESKRCLVWEKIVRGVRWLWCNYVCNDRVCNVSVLCRNGRLLGLLMWEYCSAVLSLNENRTYNFDESVPPFPHLEKALWGSSSAVLCQRVARTQEKSSFVFHFPPELINAHKKKKKDVFFICFNNVQLSIPEIHLPFSKHISVPASAALFKFNKVLCHYTCVCLCSCKLINTLPVKIKGDTHGKVPETSKQKHLLQNNQQTCRWKLSCSNSRVGQCTPRL